MRHNADMIATRQVQMPNPESDFTCCRQAAKSRIRTENVGGIDELVCLRSVCVVLSRIMKPWIAFIISFALTFAGFANAVDAAMLCNTPMDQHDTPSLEAGTHVACANCPHVEPKSDHDHGSNHAQPGKCVSSCCGSMCFLPTQVQLEPMISRGTYSAATQDFVVESVGLVQERPPKILG